MYHLLVVVSAKRKIIKEIDVKKNLKAAGFHEALNTEKDRAQSIALGYFLLMG